MWDALNVALSSAVDAIGPLLALAIGIPLAFLGFKIVKRVINESSSYGNNSWMGDYYDDDGKKIGNSFDDRG